MLRIRALFRSHENKRLFYNVQNLFFFQATNYILPLVTIPYIVRVIGPEKFGILSFAEALNQYFVMITEYGFNITGTQQISLERDRAASRNAIFSSITAVKLLLMVLCALVLILLLIFVESLRRDWAVYLLYFSMVPANVLLSYWFYLGMEEMHYLNYPNLITKLGYTAGIFLFLHREEDFYLVPLFYGGFMVVGGIVSAAVIFRKFKIKWEKPSRRDIFDCLKKGWSIFISTFAINLYRRSNVFLLGLFASKEAVGFYSAGEKIVVVLQSLFNPVIQAFYPFISRKKKLSARHSLKSIFFLIKWLGGGTALLAIAIIIFAKPLTLLALGDKFLPSVRVLQIAALVISLGVLNYVLGIIFMTNFDFEKEFSRRVMVTGLFNIILCSVLSYFFLEIGAAIAFVFAEFFLLILLSVFMARRQSLWRPANG